MERDKIFRWIDRERKYQDEKWGGDDGRTYADFIVDIEIRLTNAKKYNYDKHFYDVRQELMKIAALSVCALEKLQEPSVKSSKKCELCDNILSETPDGISVCGKCISERS